ncbi:timeless protein-domain-containing protein [Piptocephalis cylindrospora]|uniref:Timeless protein-domain-containing protein n=1 Tax=Piptocephalis cylindrospora TaxID=1907219 RepID=A0A4P9Y8G3_9FUNG|nr:timeless protein-domain-containing protein [Piptocephalis cylindrospora]|eukprot:RKP15388.1 timeless protein-domain-containing protein [Piptocephalis cylindrospora]
MTKEDQRQRDREEEQDGEEEGEEELYGDEEEGEEEDEGNPSLLDPILEDHILSICTALGGPELDEVTGKESYALGDECLDCLKDLKRFLREDDQLPDKPLLRTLGNWKMVQTDLLPIFLLSAPCQSKEQGWLAGACVELLVPLTWPIDARIPHYVERRALLWKLKELFLGPGALPALFHILMKRLAIPARERTAREGALLRLTLTLLRNLLAIPDPLVSALDGASREVQERGRMQERLILSLSRTRILQLLLTMASSCRNMEIRSLKGLVLECCLLVIQSTDPRSLRSRVRASTVGKGRDNPEQALSQSERYKGVRAVMEEVEKEEGGVLGGFSAQVISTKMPRTTRHARFGGALEVALPDGRHLPLLQQARGNVSFDTQMHPRKKTLPVRTVTKSSLAIPPSRTLGAEASKCLMETLDGFLQSCFNEIIPLRLAELERETLELEDGLERDHLIWSSIVDLCLSYLLSKDPKDLSEGDLLNISSVMTKEAFRYVGKRMMISLDEKRLDELYSSVGAYRSMLLAICHLSDLPGSERCHQVAQNLQDKLFYEKTTLDFLKVLCDYPGFTDPRYLDRLFELVHISIHLLENYVHTKTEMYVRRSKKDDMIKERRARKKRKQLEEAQANGDEVIEEDHIAIDVDPDGDLETREEGDGEMEGGEKSQRRMIKEKKFDFEVFERSFGREGTVLLYCTFLQRYLTTPVGDRTRMHLTGQSILRVVGMFQRIYTTHKIRAVFWKVSILLLFQDILQRCDRPNLDGHSPEGQLVHFIRRCLRHFFILHRRYPLLLVEAMFPKLPGDVRSIQEAGRGPKEGPGEVGTSLGDISMREEEEEEEEGRSMTSMKEEGTYHGASMTEKEMFMTGTLNGM